MAVHQAGEIAVLGKLLAFKIDDDRYDRPERWSVPTLLVVNFEFGAIQVVADEEILESFLFKDVHGYELSEVDSAVKLRWKENVVRFTFVSDADRTDFLLSIHLAHATPNKADLAQEIGDLLGAQSLADFIVKRYSHRGAELAHVTDGRVVVFRDAQSPFPIDSLQLGDARVASSQKSKLVAVIRSQATSDTLKFESEKYRDNFVEDCREQAELILGNFDEKIRILEESKVFTSESLTEPEASEDIRPDGEFSDSTSDAEPTTTSPPRSPSSAPPAAPPAAPHSPSMSHGRGLSGPLSQLVRRQRRSSMSLEAGQAEPMSGHGRVQAEFARMRSVSLIVPSSEQPGSQKDDKRRIVSEPEVGSKAARLMGQPKAIDYERRQRVFRESHRNGTFEFDIKMDLNGETNVFSWGNGADYQLGNTFVSTDDHPTRSPALDRGLISIATSAHGQAVFGLNLAGRVFAWGSGPIGLGSRRSYAQSPQIVTALKKIDIVQIVCSKFHVLCISRNRRVYGWGLKQLTGLDTTTFSPRELTYLKEKQFVSVSCNNNHSAGITRTGQLYTWGRPGSWLGYRGAVGAPQDQFSIGEVKLDQNASAKEEQARRVSCGLEHTAVVSSRGHVYTFGRGNSGRLGHGDEWNCDMPTRVSGLDDVTIGRVSCGDEHSLALSTDGEVFSWGSGKHYRLGHGDTGNSFVPKKIESLTKQRIVRIFAGATRSCVLTGPGDLMFFGLDPSLPERGQPVPNPTPRPEVSHYLQGFRCYNVALGENFALALTVNVENDPQSETQASQSQRLGVFESQLLATGIVLPGRRDRRSSTSVRKRRNSRSRSASKPRVVTLRKAATAPVASPPRQRRAGSSLSGGELNLPELDPNYSPERKALRMLGITPAAAKQSEDIFLKALAGGVEQRRRSSYSPESRKSQSQELMSSAVPSTGGAFVYNHDDPAQRAAVKSRSAKPRPPAGPAPTSRKIAQPISSRPSNMQQPISSRPSNMQQPISSRPSNAQQPISSRPSNAQQPVSSQPSDRSQPISSRPSNASQPISSRSSSVVPPALTKLDGRTTGQPLNILGQPNLGLKVRSRSNSQTDLVSLTSRSQTPAPPRLPRAAGLALSSRSFNQSELSDRSPKPSNIPPRSKTPVPRIIRPSTDKAVESSSSAEHQNSSHSSRPDIESPRSHSVSYPDRVRIPRSERHLKTSPDKLETYTIRVKNCAHLVRLESGSTIGRVHLRGDESMFRARNLILAELDGVPEQFQFVIEDGK
eukprot:311261_1